MSLRRMELFLSRLLRLGVLLCGVTMALGLCLLWWSGDTSSPLGVLSVEWILFGDPFLQPSHVLFVGFLILVATPVMRVAASVATYASEGDWVYAAITGTVLVILAAGMFLGLG